MICRSISYTKPQRHDSSHSTNIFIAALRSSTTVVVVPGCVNMYCTVDDTGEALFKNANGQPRYRSVEGSLWSQSGSEPKYIVSE
jgi:hypothetical protein